ncbi:Rap guanine nucleotide exchange factor 1, partial [Fasciola gigantica]
APFTAQNLNALFPHVFRVTYPTFTTPDRVIERLIQVYVAYAPLEPGCQSTDWSQALTVAEFLVTIVMELHPEQLSARLVLRLARFARLLILDGLNESQRVATIGSSFEDNVRLKNLKSTKDARNPHKSLADRLFDSLPLLSASAQLRERTIRQSKQFDLRPRRNSSHVPRDIKRASENVPKPTGSFGTLEPPVSVPVNQWSSKCLETTTNGSSRKSSLEVVEKVDNNEGSFTDAVKRAKRFTEASALAVATELTRMEEEVFAEINHLKQLKNFSSFLALLLAVQEIPETLLFKKSKMILAKFSSYMKPPMFTEYRRDLEAASLPYLPYLGLIFQQLIHLHAGNPTFLSDVALPAEPTPLNTIETSTPHVLLGVMANPPGVPEQFVNMWRCWKHYLILGYFIKRRENPDTGRHCLPRDAEIEQILSGFQDRFSDTVLDKAKENLVANMKLKKSFWTGPY